MYNNKKQEYVSPEMEVLDARVERGLAGNNHITLLKRLHKTRGTCRPPTKNAAGRPLQRSFFFTASEDESQFKIEK